MKRKLIEHLLSIALISTIILFSIIYFRSQHRQTRLQQNALIEKYLDLNFIDYDRPLHRALLKETLTVFYPDQAAQHDSLIRAIDEYRQAQIAALSDKGGARTGLTFSKFIRLSRMYLVFILAYLLVMVSTYYGVQTLAILRFVKMKQNRTSCLAQLARFVRRTPFPRGIRPALSYLAHTFSLMINALLKGILYMTLFSPAYVIAYSFKTRFNTDTFFFMVLLGIISNGLLITYAQKFYTFLIAESRKGYVQTAIVKNLSNSYAQTPGGGITLSSILSFRKTFPNHVFQHIYINARHQYLSTIKEQASFLITGLVIIEMALNIHGHLCYELLQNILYKQFDVVLVIIGGIFLVVKATEMFADYWQYWEFRKYNL